MTEFDCFIEDALSISKNLWTPRMKKVIYDLDY